MKRVVSEGLFRAVDMIDLNMVVSITERDDVTETGSAGLKRSRNHMRHFLLHFHRRPSLSRHLW